MRSLSLICRSTLAGTPAAMLWGGMSRVTTAPAAMILPAPMVTPPQTDTPEHSQQWSPMVDGLGVLQLVAAVGVVGKGPFLRKKRMIRRGQRHIDAAEPMIQSCCLP